MEWPHGTLLEGPLACDDTEDAIGTVVEVETMPPQTQVDGSAPETLEDLKMGRPVVQMVGRRLCGALLSEHRLEGYSARYISRRF